MKKTPRQIHLLRKFGISEDQYNELLLRQDYKCFICKRPWTSFKNRLAVDHHHGTGELRGLLCFRCNKFQVGRRTRDDVETLKRLIEYLDREYTGWFAPPKIKKKKKRNGKRKKTLRVHKRKANSDVHT
jgi:hypothetical protein